MAQLKPILLKPLLTGQGFALFGASELARLVENFTPTRYNTLTTLNGPCTYDLRAATSFTNVCGVFHATLMNGTVNLLLARVGSVMYMHIAGSWVSIKTGLSNDTRAGYPDMWCVLNDRVIWSNGLDSALQIDAHGRVFKLGFTRTPSAPSARGPTSNNAATTILYPNYYVSWPGNIGSVAEVLSGETGTLMRSEHRYAIQLVHVNGDVGPLSPLSEPVVIDEIHANPYFTGATVAQASKAELSQLLRQFYVTAGANTSTGDVAGVYLFRTRDILRWGFGLYFVAWLPGVGEINHPDAVSDAYLGFQPTDAVPVPLVHAMCNHNGRLAIAHDAKVMLSEPGLAGTYAKNSYTYPSTRGAKVTALASFGGRLLAWTATSLTDITPPDRFAAPVTLLDGAGTPGPRTVQITPGGALFWLSSSSAYVMTPDGAITEVGQPLHQKLETGVNKNALKRAVSVYWPRTKQALVAVPPAGKRTQTTILALDTEGRWSQYDVGIDVRDMALTDDHRQMVLLAGNDTPGSGSTSAIFAWDREHQNYTPPTRYATWRSNWITYDELGSFFTVSSIIFDVVDASTATFSIRLYRNGSWATPLAAPITKMAINADYGSGVYADRIGVAVNNTAKMREPRVARRQVHCGEHLSGITSFAFEITMLYPGDGHIGPNFEVWAAPLQVDSNANSGFGRIWKEPDGSDL